jgi:hypothetical protein
MPPPLQPARLLVLESTPLIACLLIYLTSSWQNNNKCGLARACKSMFVAYFEAISQHVTGYTTAMETSVWIGENGSYIHHRDLKINKHES